LARVIVGEVGIGKTALVDAFLSELPEEAAVFRIECSPVNIDLPYIAASHLLRDMSGTGGDEPLDEAAGAIDRLLGPAAHHPRAGDLVEVLAELATGQQRHLLDAAAATEHHRLVVRAMRVLFGAVASNQPTVVVIDSLQWADQASLRLLRELLSQREPLPLLTLLVTRPSDRVDPFIATMMRIELSGLSSEDQVRLVQARLGVRDGVAEVCHELVPRVGGNPHFMLEMVDGLLERGALEIVERDADEAAAVTAAGLRDDAALVRHDERWGEGAEDLPLTIEQLVADRLSELPPTERDVVDWLAVAGGPLSGDDLLALTRLADDEAMARLCARGLCDRKGRLLDFRHPLAREVAYGALEAGARARMHRRLGEHLANTPLARGLSAAIVAHHLELGQAPAQAAEHYLEAAQAARQVYQTQLGLRYWERTLQLLPLGDSRRMVAHEALEGYYRHLGQGAKRREHLAALRRLARASRQARWAAVALARTARLYLDKGADPKASTMAERAADMARLADSAEAEVQALTVLCDLQRDLGDVDGALQACERALEVAGSGQVSARARAQVLRSKGVLLRRAGRLSAAAEAHAEAIAVFKAVGARRDEARARNALGFALFVLGRYEDAVAMCLSSIAIDVVIGGRYQVAKTLSNIGMSYARLGQVEHGLAYLGRAREAHERYDDHDGHIDTLLVTSNVCIEKGDLAAARQVLGDASALAAVAGTVYDRVHQRICHGLLARAEGDLATAATVAAEARRIAESQGLISYQVYATAIEAAARVDLGDLQTGILLATNAMGAVEAMEGSEYGIEVRSLCCDAMLRGHPMAREPSTSTPLPVLDTCQRALEHVQCIAGYIRDSQLRELFRERSPVKRILEQAAELGVQASGAQASDEPRSDQTR